MKTIKEIKGKLLTKSQEIAVTEALASALKDEFIKSGITESIYSVKFEGMSNMLARKAVKNAQINILKNEIMNAFSEEEEEEEEDKKINKSKKKK